MADNVTLDPGTGGATLRTFEDTNSIQWPSAVVCYATTVGTPDVLAPVTSSAGLPVAQQGTWTVTANAGTGTFAVSAASLPLPSGAATAAKQPALGTAGTASSDVLTIQGIASMTAVKVDGSAVTQPVSGTVTANAGSGTFAVSAASLPLPSGASTAAKQPALGTAGTASSDVITVQGIASMTPLTVAQATASNLNCTATLAAGTAVAGRVISSREVGSLYQGSTSLTPAYATFSTSSSGNTQVVAAQGSGNKIRVLRYRISSNGSTNVKFQSASTDISGLHYLVQYASGGGGPCEPGLFQTAANEALNVNNSAAVAISGEITYVVVT